MQASEPALRYFREWITEQADDPQVDVQAALERALPEEWRTLTEEQRAIVLASLPMEIATRECARWAGVLRDCARNAADIWVRVEEAQAMFDYWAEKSERAALFAAQASERPKQQQREAERQRWKKGISCGTVGAVCYACTKQQAPAREENPVDEIARARDVRARLAYEAKSNDEKQTKNRDLAERLRQQYAVKGVHLEPTPRGITLRIEAMREPELAALLQHLAAR